jgi:Zn-dependent metalloprotease
MSFRLRRRPLLSLLVIALLCVGSSPSAAKRANGARADAWPEILPDESETIRRDGDLWVNERTSAAVAIRRVGYPVTPDLPEAMARQYLAENAGLLGLEPTDLSELELLSTWESPAGLVVRLQQTVDGVPVDRAVIVVTINRRYEVSFVTSGYQPDLGAVEAAVTVSEATARGIALDYLELDGTPSYERTRLIVYPRQGLAHLAWQTRVVPAVAPTGDWEVLVDASSGEILKVADRAYYVDGDGGTFDPDPLSSAGATYGDPGYVDGNDADTSELLAEIFNRVLHDLTFSGGMHQLAGPYAEIKDFEGPFHGLFSQPGSTFDFTRNESGFEAVLCYFHIDQIMRYIDFDLGLDIAPYQYATGVRYDPHALNGADNSYYSSSTGAMAFGEGGVDDSEDADVVIHELGHGLHDWVTGGHLSQVDGLSEGFGDYIAASYSRSLGQWDPSDPQYHWVFSWDGHNPFWGGRVTNYSGHYPEDLTGSIHTDGQIWSTCNMRIWDEIGRQQTDRAMLVGLASTGSGTNQEQAAAAVLQAAVDLGYPSSELTAMHAIYSDCGYDVGPPPAGLGLTLGGTCPGTLDIGVSGATANGRIALYFGSGAGSTTVDRGHCAGTEIDLSAARRRAGGTADGSGDLDLPMQVPGGACGRPVQALDMTTCETSNTDQVP